jgi:hypothetical protein
MRERFDPPEAHMVGATAGTVDHGVGFAGQFIMQPGVDETPATTPCRVSTT